MLRVRLCTKCITSQCVVGYNVCVLLRALTLESRLRNHHFWTYGTLRQLRDPAVRVHEILPTECSVLIPFPSMCMRNLTVCRSVNYPSYSGRSTKLETVAHMKDIESYKSALQDLKEKYPDDAVFEAQRKVLDTDMAAALKTRQEVGSSILHRRWSILKCLML